MGVVETRQKKRRNETTKVIFDLREKSTGSNRTLLKADTTEVEARSVYLRSFTSPCPISLENPLRFRSEPLRGNWLSLAFL
ncbi:hypothetical protein TNIN_79761 [Trichonephila inaurata madagascariensis]|uniref:Uncharacterized protein n=1 Tax=Trichonephila inaurata madagascariensis TaxID=2747483 RepID=A0A8X6X727_9ARAC|nr:hypothetical protein TNIN_79761 [Trichonephila inaurata madagascariensis]